MVKNKYLGQFFSHVRIRRIKAFCLLTEILMLDELKNCSVQMVPCIKVMLKCQYFLGIVSHSLPKKS